MAGAKASKEDRLLLLAKFIRVRVEAAKLAKLPHSISIVNCIRQLSTTGKQCDNDVDEDIPISFNITAPITKGIIALLRDLVNPSIERPFVIKSTPIPELAEMDKQRIVDKIKNLIPQILSQGGGLEDIKSKTVELANLSYEEMRKEADKATKALADRVADKMIEGGWVSTFKQFIQTFVYFPVAILKKSTVMRKVKVRDANGDISYVYKPTPTIENLNPLYFYTAPDASDIQSAEYVVEQRTISRLQLELLRYTAGYSSEQIDKAIAMYPDGYFEAHDTTHSSTFPTSSQEANPMLLNAMAVGYLSQENSRPGYYTIIGYYGSLKGEFINLFGGEYDKDVGLEAEVWMIGDIPIMSVASPTQNGRRPFYAASFTTIPGNFFGECPTTQLADIHRLCVATVKRIVRNVGFTSGPLGEVVKNRLVNQTDPALTPFEFKEVKADASNSNSRAYNVLNVPFIAGNLSDLVDRFIQWGYDAVGVPRMAFGSSTNLGSVGRTSGGMSMLMGQANKVIKQALLDIEQEVVEPLVQDYIDDDLLESTNKALIGDVKPYARSFSGLVEKEAQSEGLSWALQSIVPLAQSNMVKPQAIERLLYQMFKSKGISTDGIFPDFDLQSGVQQVNEDIPTNSVPGSPENPPSPNPPGDGSGPGAPPSSQSPAMNGGSPIPLDGRQQSAIIGIESGKLIQ